jgi:hypothetical protein
MTMTSSMGFNDQFVEVAMLRLLLQSRADVQWNGNGKLYLLEL